MGLFTRDYRVPNCGRIDEEKVKNTLSSLDALILQGVPFSSMMDVQSVCQFRYEMKKDEEFNLFSSLVPVYDKSNPACACAFDYKMLKKLNDTFGSCISGERAKNPITESMESIRDFERFIIPNADLPEGSVDIDRELVHQTPEEFDDSDEEIFAPAVNQ